MLKLRRLVRDFFGFPRAHVNAFLILLPLMFIVLISQPVFHWWSVEQSPPRPDYALKLDSIVASWKVTETLPVVARTRNRFRFDPNRIERAEMDSLGFSAALSLRITNYRKKGGRFVVKGDLLKIYGMDSSLYQQLYGYIALPDRKQESDRKFLSPTVMKTPFGEQRIEKPFDLNLADTVQLKMIKGIGSKLSSRIVKYRDALGGFIEVRQLSEIYGLDTAVIAQLEEKGFIADGFQPRKLLVNTSDEKSLSAHPYISHAAARAIVSYRFQHGDFRMVDDLRKIPTMNTETIRKITPYLEFGK